MEYDKGVTFTVYIDNLLNRLSHLNVGYAVSITILFAYFECEKFANS